MLNKIMSACFALMFSAGYASAQAQVDKSLRVSKHGEVRIENSFGSLKVVGWDKDEVSVKGRLAAGAEKLDFGKDREGTSIHVRVPDAWFFHSDDDATYASDLEVYVPSECELNVRTLNAGISVSGLRGKVDLDTENGGVTVSGSPSSVDVDAVTGPVKVSVAGAEVEVQSVSGSVTVSSASKSVRVTTTSGSIVVDGHDFEQVKLESTAGNITFTGTFEKKGGFDAETFSGHVALNLQPDVAGKFSLNTFGGRIDSQLGPPPRREGNVHPYAESRFTIGSSEFNVDVQTYSGNIILKTGQRAPAKSP